MFIFISVVVALVCLTLASYADLRTREVPDYISGIFIASALFIRFIWVLYETDVWMGFWTKISFIGLVGFSYLMYKSGQWGGGDVKIMAAVAILFSYLPGETIPFSLNYLFNILIVGAFYGLLGIFVMGLRKYNKINKKVGWKIFLLPGSLVVIIPAFMFLIPVMAFMVSLLAISFAAMYVFKKVESEIFEGYVDKKRLTEGDWLVKDLKVNGKLLVKKKGIGLTMDDIKKIKRSKIKKVLIKEGIPFIPVFLIAFIVTLLTGNILLALI